MLERLRADPRTALIPVVVLTSSSEEDDLIACYRLGANSYVRKPVEFHRFVDAVQATGIVLAAAQRSPVTRTLGNTNKRLIRIREA